MQRFHLGYSFYCNTGFFASPTGKLLLALAVVAARTAKLHIVALPTGEFLLR